MQYIYYWNSCKYEIYFNRIDLKNLFECFQKHFDYLINHYYTLPSMKTNMNYLFYNKKYQFSYCFSIYFKGNYKVF